MYILEDIVKSFEELWKVKLDVGKTRWDTVVVKCFTHLPPPHHFSTFLIDALWVGKGRISYSTDIGKSPYLSSEFINDFQKFVERIRKIDELN